MSNSQESPSKFEAVAELFEQLKKYRSRVDGYVDPFVKMVRCYNDPTRFYEDITNGMIHGFNLVQMEDGLTIERLVDGIWIPAPVDPAPYEEH